MIGVFDSGSGGLTVVHAIQKLAPRADIFYLADTAHLPYGARSDEDIKQLALRAIATLRAAKATTIVSACNSVSASVIRPMIELLGVRESDVVEMVGPAIQELIRRGITRAAVLATPATIRSGMYTSVASRYGIHLHGIACPNLAEIIEHATSSQDVTRAVKKALVQVPLSYSSILLGCTHYPLIADVFTAVANELGRQCTFIDPADAVAMDVLHLHGVQGNGMLRLCCTGPAKTVSQYARMLLGENAAGVVST